MYLAQQQISHQNPYPNPEFGTPPNGFPESEPGFWPNQFQQPGVKNDLTNANHEELDMLANLISKDPSFLKRDSDDSDSAETSRRNRSDLFGHSMHAGGSNSDGRIPRQSSSSTGEDDHDSACSPMYATHNGHHQQHQVLPGMYQSSVDITGLLNQQFKTDSFDMSNFFGMPQINGNFQATITGQMPSMALQFGPPPTMGLPNSMQISVPASTSANSNTSAGSVSMKNRTRSGSGENMVKCNYCPKKYNSSQIENHRNECRSIRCHECPQCGKRFKARGGLQQHSRIHLQERSYGCRFCPKRFTQKSHLDQHERIHTGLKPFQCQFCGRSFRQRSQQIGHEATHPQGALLNASINSSSSSSGIFSANTTGSDSDHSLNSPAK